MEVLTERTQLEMLTNHSLVDAAKKYTTYQVGMYIERVYFPIILTLGIPGNILSLLVMMRKSNRALSCCWYFAALAVSDTGLLVSYFTFWLEGGILSSATLTSCRIMTLFFYWFSINSISLIVCLTADRCVAVVFPLKFLHWRHPSRARTIIACLFVITCIFNIPHCFTSSLRDTKTCGSFSVDYSFTQAYSILQMVLFCVFPTTTIFIMNIFIIQSIKKRSKVFLELPIDKKNVVSLVCKPSSIQEAPMNDASSSSASICQVSKPSSIQEAPMHDANSSSVSVSQVCKTSSVQETPMNDASSSSISVSQVSKPSGIQKAPMNDASSSSNAVPDTNFSMAKDNNCSGQEWADKTSGEECQSEGIKAKMDMTKRENACTGFKSGKSQVVEDQLAIMLVAVSFVFLVLTLPLFLLCIVYTLVEYKDCPQSYALYVMLYNLTNKLYMTNNAINFYVYSLTGSRFRRDLKQLCTSRITNDTYGVSTSRLGKL